MVYSFKVYKLYMCMYVCMYYIILRSTKKANMSMSFGKFKKGVFRLTDEERYYHEHRTGEGFEPSIRMIS